MLPGAWLFFELTPTTATPLGLKMASRVWGFGPGRQCAVLTARGENSVPVQGDKTSVGIEDKRIDFQLLDHESAASPAEIGEMHGQVAESHAGADDLVGEVGVSLVFVLFLNAGGIKQRLGPLAVDGRQDQIGGRKVFGEMLRVAAALAKGDHRTEGVAFTESQQYFVAQVLGIIDEFDDQDALYAVSGLFQGVLHLIEGKTDERQILDHYLDGTGFLFVGDVRANGLEHNPAAGDLSHQIRRYLFRSGCQEMGGHPKVQFG